MTSLATNYLDRDHSNHEGSVRHVPTRPSPVSRHELRRYIREFGGESTSYFHLQDGVDYFHLRGIGFVSYREERALLSRMRFVFAKPVCADVHLNALLDRFMEWNDVETVFLSADAQFAELLNRRGYRVNDMGSDFIIPLDTFKVSGRKMRHLKAARNLVKHGLTVEERSWSEIDASEVHELSHAWRQTKKTKHGELKVMTRPPKFEDEWAVRKFYCFKGDELLGFVFFDPFFQNGKVVGYTANILRSRPDATENGLLDFVILEAMKVFKEEGAKFVSLGLSPLHNVESDPRENRMVRALLEATWKYGNFLYSFQNLSFHKTRYRVPESKLYACTSPNFNPVLGLVLILKTCGIVPQPWKELHELSQYRLLQRRQSV